MSKKLSEYLESIGQEISDQPFIDVDDVSRPITKDEALAREVWKRALGYEVDIENADKTITHRVFAPDPRAQTFIFERREGKNIIPTDERTISLIDKISEISKARLNEVAEQIVNDTDSPTTDAE